MRMPITRTAAACQAFDRSLTNESAPAPVSRSSATAGVCGRDRGVYDAISDVQPLVDYEG